QPLRELQSKKGGNLMSQVGYATSSYKTPLHHRIIANLPIQASWIDSESGETISIHGTTENVGETSTLVNLEVLPPVGSAVTLRILDEERSIIEVSAQVIRVERDPSKPLAALTISENLKKWRTVAMTAAEKWVTRHWHLNYDEEWVN
ncbi:MAG: hypothetical protein M3449_07055, partial [Acidobacteriota bacterium]|nr:hypothetical protein [Acidobacteriota bacterium]